MIRSYRISDHFDKRLREIQDYLNHELGIHYNNEEIFDEMIDLYYCRLFLKSNILDELFKEELRNNLQIYLVENAKMNNHIIALINELKNQKKE